MKIGFDAKRLFMNYTGLGNYSRILVSNLQKYFPDNQYFLYTPKAIRNKDTEQFFDSSKFTIRENNAIFSSYWRSFSIVKDLKKDNIDVFHGLSAELPFGIHRSGIKSVVTIHDLIFKFVKEDYKLPDRIIYDLKTGYACKRADKIFTISQFTKKDLIRIYEVNPENISVIYLPVSGIFTKKYSADDLIDTKNKFNLPDRFFLYVGSVIKRKNLRIIIEAMRTIDHEELIPLVVVGNGKKYLNEIRQLVKKYSLDNKVIFLKDINNQDLPKIYQLSDFFVFPSYYEGFGLPVLEAIQSGKPVLASDNTSLVEVADNCGYFQAFDNIDAWAGSIKKMIYEDTFPDFEKNRNNHLQKFEPETITTEVMKEYENLFKI